MKNIFKIFTLCLVMLTMSNCEEIEKSPLAEERFGAFVTLDVDNAILDAGAPETSAFSGTFRATNDQVASHSVEVSVGPNGGAATPFVEVFSATSFPAEMNVTMVDIAAALGVDVSEILIPGSSLNFIATTTATDGTVVSINDLNADLVAESGQRQGYRFTGTLVCPAFDISELVGTYDVTRNLLAGGLGLTDPNPVREVIAGPGANQITVVGGSVGFAGGDDLIIDVDTTTGVLSLGLDDTGSPGLAFPASILGFASDYNTFADGGITFACLAQPTINAPVTLTCCGGVWTLTLRKQ